MNKMISLKLGLPETYIFNSTFETNENIKSNKSFDKCMMNEIQKSLFFYYNFISKDPYALIIFFLLINEILIIE
jgi:hypothetical protein